MATTWNIEGQSAVTWTTGGDAVSQLGTIATTTDTLRNYNLLDDEALIFGGDADFTLEYNPTSSQLEFKNSSGTILAHLSQTGFFAENLSASSLDADSDGRFEFNSALTVSGSLTDGVLATFLNNDVTKFSIDYNGVLNLATQGSTPTAVAGGLYFDGTNLFFGITE